SSYDDTLTALPFLAEQMRTPTTLFDAASCLVLPAPGDGPAVLLVRSTDKVVATLLSHFGTVTLVDQPPLLGTSPFQLYIVTPSLPGAGSRRSECTLTSMRAGDQLLTTFRLPQGRAVRSPFSITSQFLMTSPYNISLGPLHFETADTQGTRVALEKMDGGNA